MQNVQYTPCVTMIGFSESNADDSAPPSKRLRKQLCMNVTAPTWVVLRGAASLI